MDDNSQDDRLHPPTEPMSDGPELQGDTGEASAAPAYKHEDELDLVALRAAFELRPTSVDAIADLFGTNKSTVYRLAKKYGWSKRQGSSPDTEREEPGDETSVTGARLTTADRKAALAERLFHALEEKVVAFEEEALLHDTSHCEKDAKALTAMANTLDHLASMLGAAPVNAEQTEDDMDIDAYRRLLKDRLDRLRQSQDGG